MNTFYFIVQQTMFFAIPLLIVGLGAMYSERSGVSNIGLEGIMIIGAFVGVITLDRLGGILHGQLLYLAAILLAALAGLGYSLIHAWSAIRLKADQTISGTALNLFAPAFCIFMAREIYGAKQIGFADQFRIEQIPVLSKIPVIGPCFFTNCYISTYIGIALLIVLAFLLNKTVFGLRLSACGENPDSAASVGIPVTRMRYRGVAISGILGGAGGILFVVPTSTEFAGNVSGYGFLALAVLILGQWKPIGICIAAFFFGILKAFSSSYSGISFLAELGIPSEVYKMIPYILTMVVLAISASRSVAPKAVGKPYDDGVGFMKGIRNDKKGRIKVILVGSLFVIISIIMAVNSANRYKKNSVSSGYGAQVALCIDTEASIDDKSFTQDEWRGVVEFSDEYGFTRKYYQAQDASQESLSKSIDLAVKGNARYVIAGAQNFESIMYYAQDKYPDTKFIAVDCPPKSPDGKIDVHDNVLAISVAEHESGFLAGYAAVMDGYRNLGYIGGMALPPVKKYGYGFLAGADYAAKELGLKKGDVTIKYNYYGAFIASPEVLAMSSSWYQSGTEVIFACGGPLGNSVMKAAEASGKKVIGVDSDQSGESTSVITSAMKNIGGGIKDILSSYENGNAPEGGQIYLMTAKDNGVKLPMETSRFRTFSQEQYDKIFNEIAEGKIDIPDDTAASTAAGLPLDIVVVKEIK